MDSRTAKGGRVLPMQNSAESGCEFSSDIWKIPHQRSNVFMVIPCKARSPPEQEFLMRILSDNDYLLSAAVGPSKLSKQPANSTRLNSKCSWKVLFIFFI